MSNRQADKLAFIGSTLESLTMEMPRTAVSDDQSGAAGSRASAPNQFMKDSLGYSSAAIARAQRAVRCSPFYYRLLAEMGTNSVSVPTIAEDSGMLKGYTQRPLSDVATETELLWLVDVGMLRREVDGQGLTDSFRLTPLGRQLVGLWQSQGCPNKRANLADYVKNGAIRRLRIPDWLG